MNNENTIALNFHGYAFNFSMDGVSEGEKYWSWEEWEQLAARIEQFFISDEEKLYTDVASGWSVDDWEWEIISHSHRAAWRLMNMISAEQAEDRLDALRDRWEDIPSWDDEEDDQEDNKPECETMLEEWEDENRMDETVSPGVPTTKWWN